LSDVEADVKDLSNLAVKIGSTRARPIKAEQVVVDERVRLKCRYPPCVKYGRNLMCPPFTPEAEEFRGYLSKYEYAVLVQVEFSIPKEVEERIQRGDARFLDLMKDEELNLLRSEWMTSLWKRLYDIVVAVEREAFNRGYYLSLGLIAGSCMLCDECDPKSPCRRPWEARPSMEGVGIDVYRTAKNAGLDIEFPVKATRLMNGLILVE